MLTISAAAFRRHIGRYQTQAEAQPIAIARHGRQRVVVLSAQQYRRLHGRSREALPVGELSDADLEAIATTDIDPRHHHLDAELG
jgi:PHD/YefM family antitoxin component YafN of YafNO toxin-antitoxin module